MKTCPRCKESKSLNDYHKNNKKRDGKCTYCKSCIATYTKDFYKSNRTKIISKVAKWQKENPDKAIPLRRKAFKAYYDRNPQKNKTRSFINNAIRDGRFKRDNCCVCKKLYGEEVIAEAHHSDYNKPLDVTWLCRPHHRAWHRVFID